MNEAVKLKKEAFLAWLIQGSSEVACRNRKAKRALPKEKPGCGRSSGRLRRRTFGWPQGSSGKSSKGRAWLRLCSVGEENCWPGLGISSSSGNSS